MHLERNDEYLTTRPRRNCSSWLDVMRKMTMDELIKIRPESLRPLFLEKKYEEQLLGTGTGFPVVEPSSGRAYLITARHNLTGRHAETGECLCKAGGIPNRVSIHFHRNRMRGELAEFKIVDYRLEDRSGRIAWVEHPKDGASADIAALPLTFDEDVFLSPFDLIESHEREIGPADPVSVIGFPFGKTSGDGLPLWATGYMASEPNLSFEDKPILVIDCRARPGQSGSPVVSFRSDGIVGHNPFQGAWTAPSSDFLGVYSGRINNESDLGIVWKRSSIRELINIDG